MALQFAKNALGANEKVTGNRPVPQQVRLCCLLVNWKVSSSEIVLQE